MNPNLTSANKWFNLRTMGTTTIPLPANPRGKLILISLIVNTKGGSSNTLTIYDSDVVIGANDEQKIATIDTTDIALIGRLQYNLPMYNGIYLVLATGTAPDITVIYAETP
jgi:hypothetical protein